MINANVQEGSQLDEEKLSTFEATDHLKMHILMSDHAEFTVLELEKVYTAKLDEINPKISGQVANHSTRFAKVLEEKADYLGIVLLQRNIGEKYMVRRKDAIMRTPKLTDWCDEMRSITEPIRNSLMQRPAVGEMVDLDTNVDLPIPQLRMLITMICENAPRHTNIPKPLETICQLIAMHCKKFHRPSRELWDGSVKRVNKEMEMPIPRYTTLKLYSIIRSKELVQAYFHLGLGLSYNRLMNFTDELTAVMDDLFVRSENNPIPSKMKRGLFTVMSDDNIDVNSKSPTATMNFHGSSSVIMQFPENNNPGISRQKQQYKDLTESQKTVKKSQIVEEFVSVSSTCSMPAKIYSPIQLVSYDSELLINLEECYRDGVKDEKKWMALVASKIICNQTQFDKNDAPDRLSWTAYNIDQNRDNADHPKSLISALPVIDHVADSYEFQMHIMEKNLKITRYLNPGQTSVSSADQPLYTKKKTMMWAFPSKFAKRCQFTYSVDGIDKIEEIETYIDDIFAFFGPLHIEKAVLSCFGDLVRGTGLDDVVKSSGLSTVGLVTAMCDVNNIKKARYTCQVVGPVLQSFLDDAYLASTDGLAYDLWVEKQKEASITFKYYHELIQHLIHINLFVRSLREANFDLFLSSLEKLCPLFFALDHVHYARWVPVFIHDLKLLKTKDPELFNLFQRGYFVVKKTGTKYSKMGFDQALEQCNKDIKSSSGISNLLNNQDKDFLRKLEHVLPEIHDYLDEFESCGQGESGKHKEESPKFISMFLSDCFKIRNAISMNPFTLEQATRLNSTTMFPRVVLKGMDEVFELGLSQFNAYNRTRFVLGSCDVISTKIPQNKLKLPKDTDDLNSKESPVEIKLTSKNIVLLREACIYREEASQKLFAAEFTGKLWNYGVQQMECEVE